MRHFIVPAVLALIAHCSLTAQVVITPMRVLLANRETSRELTIKNAGDSPVEVDIRAYFALWASDTEGLTTLDTVGTDEQRQRSCIGWTKAFPRHFTLIPGAFQRVRVLLTPPSGLADGEYTARLLITSAEVALPNTQTADSSQIITTQLTSSMSMSLAIVYRRGSVSTGLRIDSVRALGRDSTTSIFVDASPLGNAAFRGTLSAIVDSESGMRVDSVAAPFVAETPMRVRLRTRALQSGSYRLRLVSGSVLPGSAAESVLPCAPVERSYSLTASSSGMTLVPRSD